MKTPDETTVRMIPVDRIRIVNPRVRERKKYDRIVDSIAKAGLKKPITVTVGKPGPNGEEQFDLVCGQGRLEAFKKLGQTEIPAFVRGLTQSDSLLASLIENIARRRVRSLDQIQTIQWMKDQGQDAAEIARTTGLSESYVRIILNLLKNGESRLLEAVLHGRVPVAVAAKISGLSDEASQRLLTEAYERAELKPAALTAFKRIVEQRQRFGKDNTRRYGRRSAHTTADSLIRAYQQETKRQKLMVRKARLCEARLLSLSAAFKVLMVDEDFANLLRAEGLQTMPKFLAERARLSA
jgi:ParB family chromosome partitioning protein